MQIATMTPINLKSDRKLDFWKSKHVNTPELEKIIRYAKASLRVAVRRVPALRRRTCRHGVPHGVST